METAVALARRVGGGHNVYRCKEDCLRVIKATHDAKPPWWSARCTEFLRAAEATPDYVASTSVARNPVIVLEGLDGSGKTSITRWLSNKLGGTTVATPPAEWNDIRPLYRDEDEGVARAFYSAANYIAAEAIMTAAESAPFVIVDRWWCSTCAMALANLLTRESLPPDGSDVYRWPADLPRPQAGFFLHVSEDIRIARIRRRAPEDAEEQRLSSRSEMRATATEAYRRTHMLSTVASPTYAVAVNTILSSLTELNVRHTAVPFTEEEIRAVRSF